MLNKLKQKTMCKKCLEKAITDGLLVQTKKTEPAITKTNHRTIWGPLVESDIPYLVKFYPIFSEGEMRNYVKLFFQPRLSEVVGPLELAYRMINGFYSRIKGLNLKVAYNPLSVLSMIENRIVRVKTTESELLHKSMEKLALRTKTMLGINSLFKEKFNLQIAFACSCGVGAVKNEDVSLFLDSQYYMNREGNGRLYDSDVLSVDGNLFHCNSITEVPKSILEASADVGQREVESYVRYYNCVNQIITDNPAIIDLSVKETTKDFFTGNY